MLRSLHMKLVMIMVLLILSLMMVVGSFLINSVTAFYLEDFYTQMSEVFQDPDLAADLTVPAEGEEDGAAMIAQVLNAYAGELGVDGRSRKLYILDENGVQQVKQASKTIVADNKDFRRQLDTNLMILERQYKELERIRAA